MSRRAKIILIGVLTLLIILGGKFILGRIRSVTEEFVTVEKSDLEISVSISGKVKASREVSLSFPISGKLIEVASESSQVNEGDVVARVDTFDLYSAYQGALAALNKSRSAYSNAVEAKAELDATYAGREGDNIVKAKLAQGRTNVEAYSAAVDTAKFAADSALASLTKAIIRAPFSGTVVKSSYKVGEVPPMTTEVARLADLSSFYFEAEADEVDVGSLRISQGARITVDAYPNRELTGEITQVDAVSHATGSGGTAYNVKISLSAEQGIFFRSGFNGEAKIIREVKSGVLTIPAALVHQKDGKSFVRVSQDGGSAEKEIKVGEFIEGQYEVLEGLKEGDVLSQKIPK